MSAVDLFPGYAERRIGTAVTEIFARMGGNGPPLLLLHGYPETHACWHRVAPLLADRFALVIPDLRGYGASGCPPSDAEHHAYSKRAMAADMVELMGRLGHAFQCRRARSWSSGGVSARARSSLSG